jgi:hypothetical protein
LKLFRVLVKEISVSEKDVHVDGPVA